MTSQFKNLIIFTFLLSSVKAGAQNLDTLFISGFEIHGLEKTKSWYVLREIRYSTGDKVLFANLEEVMLFIKSDLRKTNLFLKVEVEALFSYEEKAEVKFIITLEENWFIYPAIIFELADRNFNVWWNEYNHSLKRINLGVGLDHNNFTGANDRLRLKYQIGYSTKAELVYSRPALNPVSKIGIQGGLSYSEYKEFAVITEYNKPVFKKQDGGTIYSTRELSLGIHYKKNSFWNYDLGFQLHINRFNGEMARSYPDFFLDNDSTQNYGILFATVSYVDLDHPLKPTRGWSINWSLNKTGIGWWEKYNYMSFVQNFKTCRKLFNSCYLFSGVFGKFALDRRKRPYNIYKSLSYGDTNISGYEYYVINGLDYFYFANELRYSLTKFHWQLFKIFKNEPTVRITTEFELSCQANLGYVNDPFYNKNNDLVNTLLYSTGIGISFTLNDIFEFNVVYGVNHLKETGFYFHTRKTF